MQTEKKVYWSQRLASVTLSILLLTVGLGNGWSSPYLAKLSMLDDIDGIPKATERELSWLASLMNVARIFGAVAGAIAQDTIGRKMALCFSGLPMLTAWICVALATNVQWLYAARILCGFSMGIVWTTMSHYLAEIADPQIRGSLASIIPMSLSRASLAGSEKEREIMTWHSNSKFHCLRSLPLVCLVGHLASNTSAFNCCLQVLWNMTVQTMGIFMGNLMGPYISMKLFAYVSIFATLMFLVLFPLIPDSPHRHVMMGNIDKAEESLKWFRRKQDVKQELADIQDYISKSDISMRQRFDEFRQRHNLKNFGLMFLTNVFLFFSAYNVINNYMEIIVTASKVSIMAPSTLVTINGFFAIVSGLIACCLVDRFGRRFLMIVSSLGVATSLAAVGVHFMLLEYGYDPLTLNWLPCVSLSMYTCSYACGMGCIPSTLVAELFSPNLKSIASLLFSGTAAVFSSLSTVTFIPIQNLIGPSYLYWFYSSGVFVSAFYYYACLAETKGQSLKDIQQVQKKEANM